MAYTQSDYDTDVASLAALRKAKATGAKTVRFPNGNFIEYRSLSEMNQEESSILARINAFTGTTSRVRQLRVVSCKGL